MISKYCPLNDKQKLYNTLHHDCGIRMDEPNPFCCQGCNFFEARRKKEMEIMEMSKVHLRNLRASLGIDGHMGWGSNLQRETVTIKEKTWIEKMTDFLNKELF